MEGTGGGLDGAAWASDTKLQDVLVFERGADTHICICRKPGGAPTRAVPMELLLAGQLGWPMRGRGQQQKLPALPSSAYLRLPSIHPSIPSFHPVPAHTLSEPSFSLD